VNILDKYPNPNVKPRVSTVAAPVNSGSSECRAPTLTSSVFLVDWRNGS